MPLGESPHTMEYSVLGFFQCFIFLSSRHVDSEKATSKKLKSEVYASFHAVIIITGSS